VRKLHDFSVSKQTWRGNRLKDITNKSIVLTNVTNATEGSAKKDYPDRAAMNESNLPERPTVKRLVVLEKSIERFISTQRQRDQPNEYGIKNLNESEEKVIRFKLKPKKTKEDKKHVIVKLLGNNENSHRQPLSIWKRNVSNKKDRPLRKTSNNADQRSLSKTSKEEDYGSVFSLKQTFRTISMKNTKNSKVAWPSFTSKGPEERTSSLPKRESGDKDTLKSYLIKSLHKNLNKVDDHQDRHQHISQLEDYYDPNIVSYAKQSLEDLDKYPEKGVHSMNDLKVKSGRSQIYPMQKNHFLIKSMSNLDVSNQIPSISQMPSISQLPSMSNVNINGDEKGFFTTNVIPTSPVRRIAIKKIIRN